MTWTPPPFEDDADAATVRILDALRDALPDWEAHEGLPEVVLAEAIGRESALLADYAASVMSAAVAGFGATVFGTPPMEAAAASVSVRLTVAAAGVVPAGFTVLGVTASGEEVAFSLAVETPAAPPHVDVAMTAVIPGALANGVQAGPMTVVTATAIVSTATALGAASGGMDAEGIDAYLPRLTSLLSALRPGGVTGEDMAALARSVPGVQRALGLDLYDPASPGVQSERTVTVVPIDAAGQPVDAGVADEVQAQLEAAREVNFVVHTAAPTYTPVDVVFSAVAETGADPVAVKAAVVAAVTDWLAPARWGSTLADPQAWAKTSTVRYLDVVRVAGTAPGVAYLDSLTIDGDTVAVTLSGAAPLPAPMDDTLAPSTVDGTVV